MKKNGRHPVSGRRARPRTIRPDGFRPLTLVPPPPSPPDVGRHPAGRDRTPGANLSAAAMTDPADVVADDVVADDVVADDVVADDVVADDVVAEDVATADVVAEDVATAAEPGVERADRGDGNRPAPDDPGRSAPDIQWRTVQPLPPPDPRASRFWAPKEEESSEALREWTRRVHQMFLDRLVERWGGKEALDQLDTSPLPDEPFDWATVPAEHRAVVQEVLALVDDTCDTWFDQEHRTACRRLLARVAGEPWIIARRGKVQTIAGTIVWTIASFNGTTGRRRRRGIVPATWIAQHLGLSSSSAFAIRAIDIRIAAGIHLHSNGPDPVGEPGLIISRRRRHHAALRDDHHGHLA